MKHKKQENPWGCTYHAAYAITGDESFLEFIDDCSTERFWCRLLERDLILDAVYADLLELKPVNPKAWDALARLNESDDESVAVLASYQMQGSMLHMLAICVGRKAVWVSDSLTDGIQSFWLEDFKETRYAGPAFIWSLHSARMDDHEPELVSENPLFATNDDNPFYQNEVSP